jgi:beta-lactamase superfamily II metal-dependent hydrolase
MTDYFEIDFLDVETKKSGDAIGVRYSVGGQTTIHVVDGGFLDTGEKLVAHILQYYDNPSYLDRVIVTHPDGDHACGLRTVLETFTVGELWMLRPWDFADELLPRFARFTSVTNLKARLRETYPHIAALEAIALARGIPMRNPFQGAQIGAFTVMAPTRMRYLDLVVDSEKTPESAAESREALNGLVALMEQAARQIKALLRAVWGEEVFATEETSAENEMSVIQFARIADKTILLTGDAGRAALTEAADFAPFVGLVLPGIDRFQVPHHGSRRNVSTAVLDRWLGPRLAAKPAAGQETFHAVISSALADKDHPRKAVVRAILHRGASLNSTEGSSVRSSCNAPVRDGWVTAPAMDYPEEQEA